MSLRITNTALMRTTLADLTRQRARLAETQEQASSGLRINRPSDDPSGASAALLLRAGLEATEQFGRNASRTRVRVGATDSALASTTDLLIRARELAINGANDTHDATSRRLLAAEVEGLHARLLSEANTRAGAAHVFAGHAADVAPFVASGPFVAGGPSPTVSFVGDSNEIEVQIDEGVKARASLDGRRVFLGDSDGNGSSDGGSEDLFDVLADLRDALVADDRVAVGATLPRLDAAVTQLSVERAGLGSTETQLVEWEDRLAQRSIDLSRRLSITQDADVADVFSRLVNEETALQAALAAAQRVIQPTLLDFLELAVLVLTRRSGESVRIGADVRVTVISASGGQVRLGIEAPEQVAVHREEVYERIARANLEAAENPDEALARIAEARGSAKDEGSEE